MKKPPRPPVSSDRRFVRHLSVDQGTPERWRHGVRVLEVTEEAGVLAARAADEHILDRLALCGLISLIQRDAGILFWRDHHAAIREARLCASYNPVRGSFSVFGDWGERTEDEEKAYARWRMAMRFLRGRLGDLMVSVVCYGWGFDPSKIKELRCGLKVLVEVYGLNKKVDEAAARQVAGQPALPRA